MTVDEAKEYLENYYITKENAAGKKYSVQYIFSSENDLNNAAHYIAENGIAAFNIALDTAIKEAVSKERVSALPSRSVTPSVAYRTVSGNGNHNVSATVSGLASFDTLGRVEYSVVLGYRVTVNNGVFTNLTNISFDIPYISPAGSWGSTTFPSYYSGTSAGVTANFTITKTLQVSIGNIPVTIKTETDNEVFALLTNIS